MNFFVITSASKHISHWGNHLNLDVILCVIVIALFNHNCDRVFAQQKSKDNQILVSGKNLQLSIKLARIKGKFI